MKIDLQENASPHNTAGSVQFDNFSGYSVDADFFSAALSLRTPSTLGARQVGLSNVLLMASEGLEQSQKRMRRSLRALSTGRDEKAKRDYAQMVSNELLTTQVLTKGLGSSIQLVEKISNLS